MSDILYGLRQIKKNLSLTILSIAVLGIGIGATTAVFAALYCVVLRPLPYREVSRLVYLHNEFPSSQLGHANVSGPDYADLTAHRELFSETAAYYFNDFSMSSMSGSGYAEHVDAVNASASLFSTLAIRPQLGRAILPDDDRYGAPKVALLSDSLWRAQFGADASVIGSTIQLNAEPYQIIGVMPPDFNFPYSATQMWVPLALSPQDYSPNERGDKWLWMLARIAPGLTFERTQTGLAAVGHHMATEYPEEYAETTGWHFSAEPMLAEQTKDVRQWLGFAFGAVLSVLLLACTNVSGLLLVRASVRKHELAVRSALGASSGRLVRQILTETALLVMLGCGAGLVFAISFVRLINVYGPIHHARIELWALAFAFGLSILSTFVAGLLPAMLSSRVSLEQSLREGAGRTTTGQGRWRGLIVAGQIGIAVALLFTAAALGRSFIKLLEVNPGFSANRVWTASVDLPRRTYTTSVSRASFFREFGERISRVPGVESATAALWVPFSSGGYTADMFIAGRPEPGVRPAARVNVVLPNYFETLKIPLLKGRTFTLRDDVISPPVVVVDEEFVREYFANEEPLGKLMANNGHGDWAGSRDHPATVIGVVGNVATRELGAPRRAEIYWPQLQLPNSAMFLVARQAGQADVTAAVREALHQEDPSVALFDVETLPQRIMDSVKLRRFVAWLLNSFALIGLILAAIGLYGTLAYLVQLRRREIAVRMALGATLPDVARLVANDSVTITVVGLIPGAIFCALAIHTTRSRLFGIGPLDPWTIVFTSAGLLAVVAVSTWLPARRACGVNALDMLRAE